MSPCGRQREYQRKEESNMKKRLLSMVLTVIMLVSLIPTSVFAAKKSVDDYFDGLPIAADPGTRTTRVGSTTNYVVKDVGATK